MPPPQGRLLRPLYDVGHGEGLAAARHAQQCLGAVAPAQPFRQFVHRLGLVAGHLEIGNNLELWHIQQSISSDWNRGKRGGMRKRSVNNRGAFSAATEWYDKAPTVKTPFGLMSWPWSA